jgi:hypothetical protein
LPAIDDDRARLDDGSTAAQRRLDRGSTAARCGRSFHPKLVEQFIRCIGYFPVGSVVELSSGEIGVVVAHNAEQRLQPKVMVVRDAHGHPLRPQKFLNLAKLPKAAGDEPYRIRRTLEFGRAGVSVAEVVSG